MPLLTAGGLLLGTRIWWHDAWPTRNVQWTIAVGFAAAIPVIVYLSTLFDWYYVTPRMSGIVCAPPCRSAEARAWRTTTRTWLLQRWLASVLLIACGAGALGTLLFSFLSGSTQPAAVATGSTSLVLAVVGVGYYLGLPGIARHFQNAAAVVGQVVSNQADPTPLQRFSGTANVCTDSDSGLSVAWTMSGERRPARRYYVVDVSLQGVKVLEVKRSDEYGGTPFSSKGELMRFEDVKDSEPFKGCETTCSGVNWYCENNPHDDRYIG